MELKWFYDIAVKPRLGIFVFKRALRFDHIVHAITRSINCVEHRSPQKKAAFC